MCKPLIFHGSRFGLISITTYAHLVRACHADLHISLSIRKDVLLICCNLSLILNSEKLIVYEKKILIMQQ